MTWDLPALLPIQEEGVLFIFYHPKKTSRWPGFEPAFFESSGQHTNHYAAKATCEKSAGNNMNWLNRVKSGQTRTGGDDWARKECEEASKWLKCGRQGGK
jgi:hypothetical protein